MRERKLSAKALSRMAGLTQDSVRALVRGRVASPRARSLAQLAAALGMSVDDLVQGTGVVPETVERAAVASGHRRELDVPEVDLRARGGVELGGDPRQLVRHRTWSLPIDMLDEQGIAPEALVVVRVSGGGADASPTDRLLVDLRERRGAGLHLVYLDGVYGLARVGLRVRGEVAWKDEAGAAREEEIVGRVVGRWMWIA